MNEPCCMSSDPAQPHTLIPRNNPPISLCFTCKGKIPHKSTFSYYFCPTCNLEFHSNCHWFKPEIRHPLHLSHSLTLTFLYPTSLTVINPFHSINLLSDDDDNDVSSAIRDYRKCKCCGILLKAVYYHCSTCDFSLNLTCSIDLPPLTISHQKSHEHTLSLFPIRQFPLPCDACGLPFKNSKDNAYTCLPCNYMVHRACIYLPSVIKITRHFHRLFLHSSLPCGDFSCGVCRQTIDVNYGQYSCFIKECSYAVHSKCATRDDVWDGIDLEGVPEEEDDMGDIEPFVKIDEETIQHFTHEHQLKLQRKDEKIHLKEKSLCQACILPTLVSDSVYTCLQCDFVLHEVCACLPRIKHHPIHKHPLILHPSPIKPGKYTRVSWFSSVESMFICDGCGQIGHGFVYECSKKECRFRVDVRCASLPDPVHHECHDHPLFFNLTRGECMRCKSTKCSNSSLECVICKSFLGLRCATLPLLAHYKHDKHPLTLCYSEEDTTRKQYWCEVCESKLDAKAWFYTCDSCLVTIHIDCLLGKAVYMKPDEIITIWDNDVRIVRNNGTTRPFCYKCGLRCVDYVVFKWGNGYYCTYSCVDELLLHKTLRPRRA